MQTSLDTFGTLVYYTARFEAALRYTIHISLPTIHQLLKKLHYVANGKEVWHE